ncbi:hypothetical protein EV193_111166 [Herbihabitans rhizosphaerae]|uniref:Uncharacterized protein n=1 Tax=Herbihabitans rhizosphaerae TaxID=1872711 RepID=A0A4Q7KF97_9PSEU|nr:DUF5994 family protein [Herbihabitans rhizosphaerae]RZS32781.1 hypothetical protein EV193_111166 [Herbihabitans rhizosphaerae]
MTSAPHRPMTPPASTATELSRHPLRLRLRPKAPTTGYVDGAWWPHGRDLSSELPALLAVLAVRLGPVQRVSYNLTEWDTPPRRLTVDGQPTRLAGFLSQPAHTMDVIASDRGRLTLLVVPPDTESSSAHDTMMDAADRDNIDTVDHLLAAPEETP